MVIMGRRNTTDPLSISGHDAHKEVFRKLNNYTVAERGYKMGKYMKVMFVRHPIERIISAYRSKLELPPEHPDGQAVRLKYGRQIIRQYRMNASQESLQLGNDDTFPEFVRYLTDPKTAEEGFNIHWRPQHKLCLPCTVSYDVIGRYETLEDDSRLVLQKAGMNWTGSLPRSTNPLKSGLFMEQYLRRLTKEEKTQLYRVYEQDFTLFNYSTSLN